MRVLRDGRRVLLPAEGEDDNAMLGRLIVTPMPVPAFDPVPRSLVQVAVSETVKMLAM